MILKLSIICCSRRCSVRRGSRAAERRWEVQWPWRSIYCASWWSDGRCYRRCTGRAGSRQFADCGRCLLSTSTSPTVNHLRWYALPHHIGVARECRCKNEFSPWGYICTCQGENSTFWGLWGGGKLSKRLSKCDPILTHGPYMSDLEINGLYNEALYKFICLLYFTL